MNNKNTATDGADADSRLSTVNGLGISVKSV